LNRLGSSLNDPLRRRALMASVFLHGLVLAGMGVYLLRPNIMPLGQASPEVANEVVFEFGGIDRAPSDRAPSDRTSSEVKLAEVKSVPKSISRVAKPVAGKPALRKPVARVVKAMPERPVLKPVQPKARVLPITSGKKVAVSRQEPNPNKPARAIESQAVPLPNSAAANAIKVNPQPIKLKAIAASPTLKPTPKASDPKPAPSSAGKPVQVTQPVKPTAASAAPTTSEPSRVETGPVVGTAASSPNLGPLTDAPVSTPSAPTAPTRESTSPASPVATGRTAATQETGSVPNPEGSGKPVAVRETGLPTLAGSSGASDPKPKLSVAEAKADSGPAGSRSQPATSEARETGPAGAGMNTNNSASSNSATSNSAPSNSATVRETGPTTSTTNQSGASSRETGSAAATPAKTPGSSQESGPGTKPQAGTGSSTGSSTPETRGPSTTGPAGATGPAGTTGSSTSESQGSGSGAGMAGPAGSKPSGSSAEGTGVSGSSGVGAEKAVRRCAIVIDVRRISPPLRANMSPAILDPNGRKIWPDANAVQDVESDLVNETGIASFVASPQAALSLLVPGVNPLEVRAVGTAMAEGVKDSSVRDYVVVSLGDAQRIVTLGKNCQVVFVK
jgi:hypothetical protein